MGIKKAIFRIIRKVFSLIPVGNVIIFESQNDFDGNSGAVYRYLVENDYSKKYRFVWAVKNYDKRFDNKKCIVIKRYGHSLKNLFYENRASIAFFDNEPPCSMKKKQCKTIYLTHGCPPLKLCRNNIFVDDKCDYALSTSESKIDIVSEQFNVSKSKIFVCGLPRNDVFKNSAKSITVFTKKKFSKTIIWMPTFRKSIFEGRNDSSENYYLGLPLIKTKDDLLLLNDYLAEKDICIIVKFHPGAFVTDIPFGSFSNLIFLTPDMIKNEGIEDFYEVFNDSDALITDYSSVSFDYLTINKPIGYILDDIEKYSLGFCVDNPKDYLPGQHLYNLNDLKMFVDNISNNVDDYKEARKLLDTKIHDYHDFNNSKRIVEMFVDKVDDSPRD